MKTLPRYCSDNLADSKGLFELQGPDWGVNFDDILPFFFYVSGLECDMSMWDNYLCCEHTVINKVIYDMNTNLQ